MMFQEQVSPNLLNIINKYLFEEITKSKVPKNKGIFSPLPDKQQN